MSLLPKRGANSRDPGERRRIERRSVARSRSAYPSPLVEGLERRWLLAVTINEFPVSTAGAAPIAITAGPDGNLWFTEGAADKIATINPTTHAVTEFPLPTPDSYPSSITVGPDGNLWFTETAASEIGMISPSTHAIAEFSIPRPGVGPIGITAGPDGNLWFTEAYVDNIGTINPNSDVLAAYSIPTPSSYPLSIAAGADGNLWFTEYGTGNIGQVVLPDPPPVVKSSQPVAQRQANLAIDRREPSVRSQSVAALVRLAARSERRLVQRDSRLARLIPSARPGRVR